MFNGHLIEIYVLGNMESINTVHVLTICQSVYISHNKYHPWTYNYKMAISVTQKIIFTYKHTGSC